VAVLDRGLRAHFDMRATEVTKRSIRGEEPKGVRRKP